VQPIHRQAILDRLRNVTSAELKHRARALARRQAQRVAVAAGRNSWQRGAIADVLIPGVLGVETGRAIQQRDWGHVEQRLRHIFRDRPCRFVIDPGSANALPREIVSRWPDAPVRAAAAADAICRGEFALLGWPRLSFDPGTGRIDWHWDPVHERRMPETFWADVPFLDPKCGDHKIIWELNRHQFLVPLGRAWWLTGDRRYAQAITSFLHSWLASNPPLIGINWASMLELALRSISWLAAMHFLLADPNGNDDGASGDVDVEDEPLWLLDMCVALDRQLTHVEQNLSYYYSPNTHLTGEALALYVAGVALPEFSRSARWLDIGRRVLLTQVDRQIAEDGGHVERSTHYHRYTLDFYALALQTAERAGDAEAVTVFSDAVARLHRFLRAVTDDTGHIPLIGDDDGGTLWRIGERDSGDVRDSLALADLLLNRSMTADVPEDVFWLAWSSRSSALEAYRSSPAPAGDARPLTASAFPDTGYVAVHTSRGDHIVFDVGPHGFLNGGHAHADALSLTMTLGSQPFLVDPGTATYTMDPGLRDRMRTTASHNALTLDGRPSAIPAGPFKWATRADAHLTTWRHNGGFAWTEACHDAYPDVRHRRTLIATELGGCLVIDEILGSGDHTATTHWQFDPRWRVTCDGVRRLCAKATGMTAWLLTDRGSLALFVGDETGVGWCSPRYGLLVPTSTAHVTHAAHGSFAMTTWLGTTGVVLAPVLERLPIETDGVFPALTARVRRDGGETSTVVRPGDAEGHRYCDTPEYHTDARLLQYSRDQRGGITLLIADGHLVTAHDDALLSARSQDPIGDLSTVYRDGCLEMYSSSPPSQLFLWGHVARHASTVRLNGRDVGARYNEADGSLTIAGAEWRDGEAMPRTLRRATDVRWMEPAGVRVNDRPTER
jgi:hypothetical protein